MPDDPVTEDIKRAEKAIVDLVRAAEADARREALEEAAKIADSEEADCRAFADGMAAKGDHVGAREQRCDATEARRVAEHIRARATISRPTPTFDELASSYLARLREHGADARLLDAATRAVEEVREAERASGTKEST